MLCAQLVDGLEHCLGIFSLSRHACSIPALRVICYSISQTLHPLKSLKYVFLFQNMSMFTPCSHHERKVVTLDLFQGGLVSFDTL